MKRLLLFLFVFVAIQAHTQHRVTIGLLGGGGQTAICNDCMFSGTSAQTAGYEALYQVINGFHLVFRNEYQLKTHQYNRQIESTLPNKNMQFATFQFGAQWKKAGWYAGAGMLASKMLVPSREEFLVYGCGVGLPSRIVASPVSFSEVDYSGGGFYVQAGLTPTLIGRTKALIEINWYRDYADVIFGAYPYSAKMLGVRLGIQQVILK